MDAGKGPRGSFPTPFGFSEEKEGPAVPAAGQAGADRMDRIPATTKQGDFTDLG